MIKTYAIDTNVLLYDPRSLLGFEDNLVILCEKVLRELDEKKKGWGEIPANAREVSRQINQLRREAQRADPQASLRSGIALPNGGRLLILMEEPNAAPKAGNNDDHTLALLVERRAELPGPVVVVTKDTIMGIKAETLGFGWQDYQRDRTQAHGHGQPSIHLTPEDELALAGKNGKSGGVRLPGLCQRYHQAQAHGRTETIAPGYFILENRLGTGDRLCHINHQDELRLISQRPIIGRRHGSRGIKPRNLEQMAAVDALLNPEKTLVCLLGKSGTGKTLLAIAAAVELSEKKKGFRAEPRFENHSRDFAEEPGEEEEAPQIVITRPMISAGSEMGFLPGGIEEKMNPWMRPIYDNLEVLFGAMGANTLIQSGKIQLQPIPLIRGRSLSNAILIIDEAQNLTPHEAKLLLTRAGQNCRVFMTGDPGQIDNPYVDATSNGLVYTSCRMGHEPFVAAIHLVRGLRSVLSERAAERL